MSNYENEKQALAAIPFDDWNLKEVDEADDDECYVRILYHSNYWQAYCYVWNVEHEFYNLFAQWITEADPSFGMYVVHFTYELPDYGVWTDGGHSPSDYGVSEYVTIVVEYDDSFDNLQDDEDE